MTTRLQELTDKSLNCIHLARAIKDRFPDPTKMPADELANMKALNKEAFRLRDLAAAEKEHNDLESWSAAPETPHPVLDAQVKAAVGGTPPGGRAAEASGRMATEWFAKALRTGASSLNMEEKAAIIENSTGQIIVPHDLAGPIFLQLPRLGVLRDLALVRPTTSNLVDVRALTGVTAGWGQIELTNAGGATPPTDAAIAATGPNTVTVQDLVALVQIGVDELQDTDSNLVSLVQEIVGRNSPRWKTTRSPPGTARASRSASRRGRRSAGRSPPRRASPRRRRR